MVLARQTAPNGRFRLVFPQIFASIPPAYDGRMPAEIYLDHNATTPVLPEVIEAMRACWQEPFLNPASQHSFGRAARRKLEDARDRIAELLGANTAGPTPDRVIFTSGGTESNNLAICGLLEQQRVGASPPPEPVPRALLSSIEHPSITALGEELSRIGYKIDRLGVDANSVLQVNDLAGLLTSDTRVVAAMLANNETGVIQPVAELAAICNERDVPLHTDASQAAGKLSVNFREIGAATMTIAAHKLGGPVGIGALLIRHDVELQPQLFGGHQQGDLRPGTESVALAVGLCTALELWQANRAEWATRICQLRNHFESLISGESAIGASASPITTCQTKVIGRAAPRLPNTSNISFEGLDRQALFMALDQAGIACSTGSACASGSSEPSPVHIAMGFKPAVVSGSLRFSFGIGTTRQEVEVAASRIINVCNSLGR
jgi:cysteine desulfurase